MTYGRLNSREARHAIRRESGDETVGVSETRSINYYTLLSNHYSKQRGRTVSINLFSATNHTGSVESHVTHFHLHIPTLITHVLKHPKMSACLS